MNKTNTLNKSTNSKKPLFATSGKESFFFFIASLSRNLFDKTQADMNIQHNTFTNNTPLLKKWGAFLLIFFCLSSQLAIGQTTWIIGPDTATRDFANLKDAMNNASVVDGDTIRMQTGNYDDKGTNGILRTTSTAISINKSVVIDGNGSTVSRASGSAVRGFQYTNSGVASTLMNITLCDFNATGGSAILVGTQPTLITFKNVSVTNSSSAGGPAVQIDGRADFFNSNIVDNGGGGVYVYGGNHEVNFTDCNISCNQTFGLYGYGGGLVVGNSTTAFTGTCTITGGTIARNSQCGSCSNVNGGALYYVGDAGGNLNITGVLFVDNKATLTTGTGNGGGAIFASGESGIPTMTITDCIFERNTSPNQESSAIGISQTTTTISNSIFRENSNASHVVAGTATITSSLLIGNQNGTQSSSPTSTYIGNTGVADIVGNTLEYDIAGTVPGTCGAACGDAISVGVGAGARLSSCFVRGGEITSTATGQWYYIQEGGVATAFGSGGMSETIPADISLAYTIFWQDTDPSSDPVLADTVVSGVIASINPTISSSTVLTAGTGYAVNDVLTILGTELGGTSPANDLMLTVTAVSGGAITELTAGTGNLIDGTYTNPAFTGGSGSDATLELIISSAPSMAIGETANLSATPAAGTWSIVSGPDLDVTQFSSDTDPLATFTPTMSGTYLLQWDDGGACPGQREITVTLPCDANAGALPTDPTGCQEITDMPDGTTSIQMLSYGFNNTADYTQAYFIVNADGTIAEVIEVVGDNSATPAAVTSGLNTYEDGSYKIYVINYETADATAPDFSTFTLETDITNLSLTSTYTSGACMVMAENSPMTITICDPACGCDDNTDSGTLTTLTAVPGSYNPAYNQTYLLTDASGLILDIQTSATFTGLAAGNYMVYAINANTNAGEDPFVDNGAAWTAITANITTIADLAITPGLADACFQLSSGFNYTVGGCPIVNPTGNDFCLGTTTTVNGTPSSGSGTYTTHAWSITGGTATNITLTNADMQTVTVNAGGDSATAGTVELTYTVTDDEGCMGTDMVTVTVTPTPAAPPAVAQAFCSSDNPTAADLLPALSDAAISWYSDAALTSEITDGTTVLTSTNYYVTTTTNSCESLATTVAVTVTPTPTAPTALAQAFCSSDNPTAADLLPALSDAAISWYSDAALTNEITDGTTVLTSTNYYVTTTTNSCESLATTVAVTVTPTPTAPTALAQAFCSSDNPTAADLLPALSDAAISWYSDAALTSEITDGTTVLTSTNYYVTTTTNSCESLATTVAVTVTPTPTAPTALAQAFCSSDNPTAADLLPALSDAAISWYSDAALTNEITDGTTVLTSTNYYVTTTTNSCESLATTVAVTVTPTPAAPPALAQAFCSSDNPTAADLLPALSDAAISWYSDAALTSEITDGTTVLTSTNYYVTTTTNSCESLATTVAVTVTPTPTAPTALAQAFCSSDNPTAADLLPALSDAAISWYSDAALTNEITDGTTVLTSTNYYVTTTTNSCESLATTVAVTVTPTPTAPTALAQAFCSSDNPTAADLLPALSDAAISWYSDAALTSEITDGTTVLTSTNYYVTTTTNSCESLATTVAVTVTPTPTAPTALAQAFCSSDNPTAADLLPALSDASISWYSDAALTSEITDGTTVLTSTNYYVTTTTNSCESLATTVAVTVTPTPTAPTALAQAFCSSDNPTAADLLPALSDASISWYSDAALTSEITDGTTVLTSTNYYVTTTTNSCESLATTVAVTVTPTPTAPTALAQAFCSSDNPTAADLLPALSDASISWYSDAALTSEITDGTTALTSTNYYVTTTTNSCESLATTVAVTVTPTPTAPTALAQAFCSSDNPTAADLLPALSDASISWYSDAALTSEITDGTTVLTSTNYYVTTTTNSCESLATTVAVTVTPTPTAPTALAQAFCSSDNPTAADLLPALSDASISWYSDAALTSEITDGTTVLTSTNYYVTTTTNSCESLATTVAVTVTPTPTAPTALAQAFCSSDNPTAADLLPALSDASISWYSDAALTSEITDGTTVLTSTNYYVTTTTNSCESLATTVAVTVTPTPTAPTALAQAFCSSDNPTAADLLPALSDASISWYSDAALTSEITDGTTALTSTNYYVTTTTNSCESLATTVAVTVTPTPTAPTALAQAFCSSDNPTAADLLPALSDAAISWYSDAALTNEITDGTTVLTSTNYYVTTTTNSCESLATTVAVTVTPTPAITTTFTNPTTCAGSEGTITINGLTPSTAYILNYNAITQNIVSLADGTYIISGLEAGAYNGITVTLNDCVSNIEAETLADPSAPDAALAVSDFEICEPLNSNITFTITGSQTSVIYQLQTADGNPLSPPVSVFGNGGNRNLTILQGNAPSETTTYQIVATNSLTGCTTILTDQPTFTLNPLPVITSINDACDGNGGTLTINTESFPSGTLEYSLNGGIPQASNVFTGLANGSYTASVEVQETGCNVSFSDNLVSCLPSLNVTKTAGTAADGAVLNISSGDDVTYTYVINNTGDVDLALTAIADVPHGNVLANGTLFSGDTDADGILDTDETWTYTLLVSNITDDVTNIVTVTGNPVLEDGTDISPDDSVNDVDNAIVEVEMPSIALTKASMLALGADGVATVGDIITYTYVVTNTGNVTLDGVEVAENAGDFSGTFADLSAITYVSSTDAATAVGTLSIGEMATYTATYAITQADIDAGEVSNLATVTGDSPMDTEVTDTSDDPTNPTDTDSDGDGDPDDPTVTPIGEMPSIALTKASMLALGADGVATVGDIITYTYVVTNTGNVTLDGVEVAENAVDFTGTFADLSAITYVSSTDAATAVGTLSIGEMATYTATYAITQSDIDAGEVSNLATVTGDSPMDTEVTDTSDDPTNPTDTDSDGDGDPDDPTVTPIGEMPSIALTKASMLALGADGLATVGDIITYTYVVTNTGNVTLDGVMLAENAVDFTGTFADLSAITYVSSTDAATAVGTLSIGEMATYTATYAITQSDIDAGEVSNLATVTGDSPMDTEVTDTSDDPTNPTDTDSDGDGDPDDPTVTPIGEMPSIALTKASMLALGADGVATVGDIITYTYVVTNTGNVTLDGVMLAENAVDFTGTFADLSAITYVSSTDAATAVGTLSIGEMATYTATYAITQADIDAGEVSNLATVTGDSPMDTEVTDTSDDPTNPTDTDSDGDGDPDDPTVTPIGEMPSIALTKASMLALGADGVATVGDIITYTYVVTNTGNVTLDGVMLAENAVDFTGTFADLSAITYVSSTDAATAVGTLSIGEMATYTATYAITQADIDAGEVSNLATVTGDSPMDTEVTDTSDDPTNPTDTDSDGDGDPDDPTVTPIGEMPSIALTKASMLALGADGVATVGDIITYTYVVTNTGNVTLDGVMLAENAVDFTGTFADLSAITYVSSTDAATAVGTLSIGEMATYTATYAITQADIDAGEVSNLATVTGDSPMDTEVTDTSDDPTNPTDTDSDGDGDPDDPTVTPIGEMPSIALTKASMLALGADGVATVGDIITYTYVVTNTGNVTLDGVEVAENAVDFTGTFADLSAITYVSSTDAATAVGTLSIGEMATYTATYAITQADIDAGEVSNLATVTGDSPMDTEVTDTSDDPTNPTDTDSDGDGDPDDPTVTPIGEMPSIALTKASMLALGADGVATVGDIITYTYVVTNTGNVTLDGVEVAENAGDFSGTFADLSAITYVSSTDAATAVGTLSIGEMATYTATYAITQADIDAGEVSNLATVTGDSPMDTEVTDTSDDPTNPTDTDSDGDGDPDDPTVTPIGEMPSIALTKASMLALGADGVATVGDIITYTYVVTNTGNVTLDGVEVAENAGDFSGTFADLSAITYVSSTDAATAVGTLSIGEMATYTATYAITQADIDAGEVSNLATVTGDSPMDTEVTDTSDDPTNPTDTDSDGDGDPDDPTVTPIGEMPSIALTKASMLALGADGVATVGDIITYTYVVTNTGNVTLDGVMLAENAVDFTGTFADLSAITYVSSTDAATAVGTLSIGEMATYTATYAITQADIDAGEVSNLATVTGDSPMDTEVTDTSDDPTNPTDTDSDGDGDPDDPTVTPIGEMPSIALTKASMLALGADGVATVGDIITYTYVVTNTGNVTLDNVMVNENGAPDFTGTGTLPMPAFMNANMGSLEGILLVGESATYTATYAITQADIDSQQVDNLATATGNSPMNVLVMDNSDSSNPNDPNETGTPGNPDEDDPTGTSLPFPLVLADKTSSFADTDGDGQLGIGEVITYSIILEHTSLSTGTAADLVFDDPIPAGVTLLANTVNVVYSATGSATINTGNATTDAAVNVTLGNLPLGETITITFDVTVDADATGTITNVGTFTSTNHPDVPTDDPDNTDNDPTNPGDPTDPTVDIIQSPQLLADKTSIVVDVNGDGQLNPGEQLDYTITLFHTAASSGAATMVNFNDPIAAGATLVANSINVTYSGAGSETINSGNATTDNAVNIDLGDLPLGQTITITFSVIIDVDATGTISNTAIFDPSNHPDVPTDDPNNPDNDPTDPTDPVDPTDNPIITPILLADKTSTYVDANEDGLLNSGEQIDYTITLFHTAGSLVDALDVVFNDLVPTNTTLTNNSVNVTYSGAGTASVNTGNSVADNAVNISLGDLPVGETITITFSVTVNSGATGSIFNTGEFSFSNHPVILTDDPNNPANDPVGPTDPTDPTETPIGECEGVLVCNNGVQISLDANCEAVLTADMILEGNTFNEAQFEVEVLTQTGASLGGVVNASFIGGSYIVQVTSLCNGSSCWGEIIVEDKLAPVCTATNDTTIACADDAANVLAVTFTDNCSAVTIEQVDELLTGDICDGDLQLIRTYVASDAYGNTSETCMQTISINRPAPIFPIDVAIDCEDYAANNALTEPSNTGTVLNTEGACNYALEYSDDILNTCGDLFKILRTWTLIDWCTGEVITTDANGTDNVQIIKIDDNTPPMIVMDAIEVSANEAAQHPAACTSTEALPAAIVTDNCSAIMEVQIFTPVGVINGNGGNIPFPGLPVGTHQVTYQATDVCGNMNEITVALEVVDDIAPVAVCDEITQVSLSSDGLATVLAETFDDGSSDNCCLDYFEVRRMTDACGIAGNTSFGPSIQFCCADLGQDIMVTMRVYDCHDNTNDCMVSVLVEDKLPPSLVLCPDDETITCDVFYNNIEVALDLAAQNNDDNPQVLIDTYGEVMYMDNCNENITHTYVTDINSCGEGSITRTWTATDASGNVANSCVQVINVQHVNNWEIQFPADITIDCGNELPEFGEPTVFFDDCELIAHASEDMVFNIVPDACYKVIRTWTAINWCVYDGTLLDDDIELGNGRYSDGTDGIITHQQIVKVIDEIAPTITCPTIPEVSVDGNCVATVNLPNADNVTDCSDDVTVSVTSDLGLGYGAFNNVALGTYEVTYTATDNCGNSSSCETTVSVADNKAPTPYCVGGLVVELMPVMDDNGIVVEGMLGIWASDFDAGSFDNCSDDVSLTIWLNEDNYDASADNLTLACDAPFSWNFGTNDVYLYVTDAYGNTDFCIVTLIIESNPNVPTCDSQDPTIAGTIMTEMGETIETVNVDVNNNTANVTTAANGEYLFEVAAGGDYTIVPNKDINPLNGVTTYDLVLIRQHILTTNPLDTPYKLIAADANNSGTVTTYDIVQLRQLILFVIDELPNNTSWRFVEENYEFPNPQNPWQENFSETASFNNLQANMTANFVGVKIGDVNASATANAFTGDIEERSGAIFDLETEEQYFQNEQQIEVPVYASNAAIIGTQFLFDFDTDVLELVEIKDAQATAENVGLRYVNDGIITTSWNGNLNTDEPLFHLVFNAKQRGVLSEVLAINEAAILNDAKQLKTEAYTNNGEIWNVNLQFVQDLTLGELTLLQNHPNPFTDVTNIRFYLPQATNAELKIMDVSGKVIYTSNADYAKGWQDLSIDLKGSSSKGMLFLQLTTPEGATTRKMVRE